jgi:hypothetical protein
MFKKMILAAGLLCCSLPSLAADADSAETRPIFLRGEMNNWEAPKAQQLVQSEAGVLSVKTALQASHGAYKFKFADEKWKGDSAPTTRVRSDPQITLDTPWSSSRFQWAMKPSPRREAPMNLLDRRMPTSAVDRQESH